jgi:hypothetical protein
MTKQLTVMDNAFAQLRNMSEYAGALKLGLEFKKMVMDDSSLNPHFKLKMVEAIDDALKNLSPPFEMSDLTIGEVIDKIEMQSIHEYEF